MTIRNCMRAVFTLALMSLLSGCTVYGPHFLTIRANYNFSRGEYQLAIVDYLRAGETGQYDRWLAYNLGNVYHFLGESNAALERWEFARATDSRDLIFKASFNRGTFFFEQGRYREARRHFRTALEIDPGSTAAKRNFELALERLAAETDLTGDVAPLEADARTSQVEARTTDGGSRMLDYMRRREEQRWRASQEVRVSPDVEDW